MKQNETLKTLKADIKELKDLKAEYSFYRVFCFNVYSIILKYFVKDNNSCFNKTFREVQFKKMYNANKFINLLNKEFKTNLKVF